MCTGSPNIYFNIPNNASASQLDAVFMSRLHARGGKDTHQERHQVPGGAPGSTRGTLCNTRGTLFSGRKHTTAPRGMPFSTRGTSSDSGGPQGLQLQHQGHALEIIYTTDGCLKSTLWHTLSLFGSTLLLFNIMYTNMTRERAVSEPTSPLSI